jgi:hypothetical protein
VGPKLIRTLSGVGAGFSSPVISGERLYITGKVDKDLKLFCFDLSGKKIWESTHGPGFSERAPRIRPTQVPGHPQPSTETRSTCEAALDA